jgi:CBS domain-containing protein
MKRALTVLGAVGVGAWLRHLFDPKRRHGHPLVTPAEDQPPERGDAAFRGIKRQRGGDEALTARIQAKLATVLREPRRIEVKALNGRVTLHGSAGPDEVPQLLRMVAQVPGVRAVEQALDGRQNNGRIGRQSGWLQAAQEQKGLLSGATGGALAVYGLRKRSLAGAGIAAVGLGLIVSGLNHQDVRRLLGLKERARRRAEEWGRSKQPEHPADQARAARSAGPGAGSRLKDIMTRDVEVLRPDVAVDIAAEAMKRLDIGAIPVCDGQRMVGILTDRDIVLRTIAEKRETSMLVADVMTTDVVYGLEDDLLEEAALKMVERRIRRLPVLNQTKELVGIVSLGDLAVHGMETSLSGEVLEYLSQPAKPKRESPHQDAAKGRPGEQ